MVLRRVVPPALLFLTLGSGSGYGYGQDILRYRFQLYDEDDGRNVAVVTTEHDIDDYTPDFRD